MSTNTRASMPRLRSPTRWPTPTRSPRSELPATAVDDPLTARALALLEQMHAPNQVEPELRRNIVELQSSLETTYATHRGVLDGRSVDDNEILEVLRTSNDSGERRAAWEASKIGRGRGRRRRPSARASAQRRGPRPRIP